MSAHSHSGLYPGKQDVAHMGTGTFPVGVAVGAQSGVTLEGRATSDPPIERLNWTGQERYMAGSMRYPKRGVLSSPPVGPTRKVRRE